MLENGFVVHVDTKDDGWPCSFLLSATMGELLSKAMIYDVRHLAIILHGIDKVELAERKPQHLEDYQKSYAWRSQCDMVKQLWYV
jgi:hypothetical protein